MLFVIGVPSVALLFVLISKVAKYNRYTED
jgi:hypothetical protein